MLLHGGSYVFIGYVLVTLTVLLPIYDPLNADIPTDVSWVFLLLAATLFLYGFYLILIGTSARADTEISGLWFVFADY